jgi:uncharacterized protein YndB with AHSA1/START domain
MINVSTEINATIEKVWEFWNNPIHVQNWYFAGDDWHCPNAENNLQVGKRFNYRMEAKDGSFGFDFEGKYTKIKEFELIEYTLEDDRTVSISFVKEENSVIVKEKFDPETENTIELQQQGWQMILNNFKKYVEVTEK